MTYNSVFDAMHDSYIKRLLSVFPTQDPVFISEFALAFLVKFTQLEQRVCDGLIDQEDAFYELYELCNLYR